MTPLLLALPVVVLAGLSAVDLVTRPTLRRLALRNISRRKGEALLVVAGSLLGTAIICASFIVGDTLDASLRDLARTQYGPIDEAVTVSGPETLPEIEAALADPVAGADGGLSMVSATATVATVDGEDRAQPRAYLHEVDFGAARDFGGEPEATGFARAGATPRAGQAVVGEDLAEDLLLAAGDRVNVFVYGATLEVEVTGTLPRLGVAGFYPESGSRSPVLFVAPGTVAPLAERAGTTATPPRAQVLVSNAGGVFDGADSTPSVAEELLARVGGIAGVEVQELKADILEEAAAEGDSFTQLFSSIGSFSVIAGILLLVNIFVMLAEERKSELGMLRAVGVKRSHLVRSFALEGGIYAVTAAVMGTAVGVGVGRVIVFVTADLFDQGDFELALRFSVTSASLVTGALIGLSIALLTVWGTSIRIGRLNVICAIRDLPEPPRQRQRLRPVVLAGSGIVLGGVLLATGLSAGNGFPALAGPAIALFCTVTLLDRLAPRRVAVTVPCAAALAWGILAFVLFPDVFEGSDIPLFILQGIILVGAAVALVSANGDVSSHLSDRLSSSGRGLAARLGLAYPLAKRFRTALLLAMYSIVIFTLTFLAVISHIFGEQAPLLTAETGAGHEILVDSNPANPVTVDQLERQPDVVAATPLV
nr:ABC transporter permease [Acidimicrobiia bacterium]